MVRHEECVETASLERLGEVNEVLQVEVGVGVGTRIPPPGGMDSDRAHKRTEMKLLGHGVSHMLVRCYSVSGLGSREFRNGTTRRIHRRPLSRRVGPGF